jgi:hypothetical protein
MAGGTRVHRKIQNASHGREKPKSTGKKKTETTHQPAKSRLRS